MPATKLTIPSAIDFPSLESQDLQDAQARYQKALSSGYDEQTAATLYLAPVQAKWKIIAANPNEFQDKSKLDKITSDFETATASAVKSMGRTDTAADVLAPRLNPLISQWSAIGVKPTLTAAQQLQLKNMQSEINREESQLNRYESAAEYAQGNANTALQQTMEAAADKQRQKVAQMRSAADALTLGLVRPGTAQRLDQVQPGQTMMPAAVQPSNPIGYTEDEYSKVLAAPPQTDAQPAASALTKKPVIFISGRPDLSNVTREEADASWLAAHPNAMNRSAAVLSTPSDVEPEQASNEVVRVTKDGRKAIFDAATKKFLRYAD